MTLSYVTFWNEATVAARAPKNDIDTIRLLETGIPNSQLAEAALTSLKRHLWYLAEETVGLALFDDRIPSYEKKAMVKNLNRPEKPKPLKRLLLRLYHAIWRDL